MLASPRLCRSFAPFAFALIALGSLATSALAAPEDADKLRRDLQKAYDSSNYTKALEIAEKIHKIDSDDLDTIYNIACLNCLLGHKDKAYEWLEKAIEAGYKDADHLVGDDDFKTIRGDDKFRTLVKKCRAAGKDGEEKKAGRDKKPAKHEEGDDDDDDKPAAKKSGDSDEKMSPQEAMGKINEMTQDMMKASEGKNYKKAMSLAKEADRLAQSISDPRMNGQKALTRYNLACMHSLMKEKEEAFKCLQSSLEIGMFSPDPVKQIENDTDFDNIRDDPRYKKMVTLAKSKMDELVKMNGKPVKFQWKVILPGGEEPSKPAPLLVALHGRGGNMNEFANHWKKAAEKCGAILLVAQGTQDLGEGHYAWAQNIDRIEQDVTTVIEKVMDEHKVDKKKVVITGFSQGGMATYALSMRSPDVFCGAIPVAGRFAPESDSMLDDKDFKKQRFYIMVGGNDNKDTVAGNKKAAKKLGDLGMKVKLNVYDDVGHAFPDNADEETLKALKFVLGE